MILMTAAHCGQRLIVAVDVGGDAFNMRT